MAEIPRVPDARLHYEAIVQWSDDAIVSKDLHGIITSWNAGAERMFGYTAEETVGRSIMLIIPQERRKEEDHVLSQVMAGKVVDHFETQRVTKDGRLLDISLTVSPIKDREGRIVGASKIARDITDRKRTEQAYLQLLEERAKLQQEAARMKDDFLAMLSHELRTPLNSILGWTELLMTGSLTPELTKEALETIRRNVGAQAAILGDLLDLSRITHGMLRLELGPVNVEKLVRDSVEVVLPAAADKRITIEVRPPPRVCLVQGDALRLQQVLWNLLSNAIKFTPPGGRIDATIESVGDRVRIRIADTGEGIPAGFLPHAFARFRQADGSRLRKHGGLGLGLALVREIVEMHGGRAAVESPGEGLGTTVTVELPSPHVPPPRFSPAIRLKSTARALQGVRILVVDDQPDDRELLKIILERSGAQVVTAGSAAEALEMIQSWRPQILISDLAMPKEGGFALIARVRALEDPALSRIPAIAVTAHLGAEDRTQALQAGFGHFLTKPVEPAELLAIIAKACATVAS